MTTTPHTPRKHNSRDVGADLSIMELGSGNVFLGVCLLALNVEERIPIRELVVTDMADHLDLMAKTVRSNAHV